MVKVDENSSVRLPSGRVTTIKDLKKQGKIKCSVGENWKGTGRRKYFIDMKGTTMGWETNLKTCKKLRLKVI